MIDKWGVSNFKSIGEDTEFDFAPLTILTGANSGGKSSLIQSILMVAQTLKHKDKDESIPIALREPLVDLGTFDEIKSKHTNSDRISIGFSYTLPSWYDDKGQMQAGRPTPDGFLKTIKCDFSFGKIDPSSHQVADLLIFSVDLFSKYDKTDTRISIKYNSKKIIEYKSNGEKIENSARIPGYDVIIDPIFTSTFSDGSMKINEVVGCILGHFLPKGLYISWGDKNGNIIGPHSSKQNDIVLSFLYEYFCDLLKYIGPLRVEPKPLNSSDNSNHNIKGEDTAKILATNKKDIEYIPSKCFISGVINKESKKRLKLIDAANDWLNYLGIAEAVASRPVGPEGKYGYDIKVINSGFEQGIDHVGTGVSQVLPIIIECLVAEPGSTLIIEEPEYHLHPRVQALLGDFFLAMIFCDKQCIIETHSEYLTNALRYRIADAPSKNPLNDKVKLYFADKQGPNSTFREIEIDEYGSVSEWPGEFFDVTVEYAGKILRAANKKRRERG
ncbi:hypothetical protein FACS189479_02930 [Spirochaetia bacterium]|nr:hypothetical protein FACS189479_02930 [Spirochaetia bacterium]